ncbi:MAG: AgmX/PglI C-terminal domain-containing protein [Polyangiales bacterium]
MTVENLAPELRSAQTQRLLRDVWSRPEDFSALLTLRDHLLAEGRIASLLRVLDWWADRIADDVGAARGIYATAEVLRTKGLPADTLAQLFERALFRDPLHTSSLQRLWSLSVAAGTYERLLVPLQRRAEMLAMRGGSASAQAEAWSRLARLRAEHTDDLDGAIDALHRAVQAMPSEPASLRSLAELYERRARDGSGSSARADRVSAAELHHALARLEPTEAVAHLERALDAWPGHTKALEQLDALTPSPGREERLLPRWQAFLLANPSGEESDALRLVVATTLESVGEFAEALEVLAPVSATGGPEVTSLRARLLLQRGAAQGPTRVVRQHASPDASIVALLDELEEESSGATDVDTRSDLIERVEDARAAEAPEARSAARMLAKLTPVKRVAPAASALPAVGEQVAAAKLLAALDGGSKPVSEADFEDLPTRVRGERRAPSLDEPFSAEVTTDAAAETRRSSGTATDRARRRATKPARPAAGRSEGTSGEAKASTRTRGRDPIRGDEPTQKATELDEHLARATPHGVRIVSDVPADGFAPRLWEDEDDDDVVLAPDAPAADRFFGDAASIGEKSRLAVDVLRTRGGRAVGFERHVPRRWALRIHGTPLRLALRDDVVALASDVPSRGEVRRGGLIEDLPMRGTWMPLRPGDLATVEVEGTRVQVRVHRVRQVPSGPREDLPTQRFGGALGAALALHLVGMMAFVALGTYGGVSLAVEERTREEIFAEARLAPEPPPEAPPPEVRPRPRPRRPEPTPPSETRTPMPRVVQRHLQRTRATSSGNASQRLASALSDGPASAGTTDLAAVVSNIDAVRGDATSAALSVHGALASLGDHGVNLASRASRDIATVGSAEATRNLEGVRASGSGRARGRVQGVRALANVQGSLSRGEVVEVINRSIGRVQRCYEQSLSSEPDLAGRVSFAWTIQPNGSVSGVRQAGGSLGSGRATTCIAGVLRGLRFPRPRGGPVAVTFPFVFQRAP